MARVVCAVVAIASTTSAQVVARLPVAYGPGVITTDNEVRHLGCTSRDFLRCQLLCDGLNMAAREVVGACALAVLAAGRLSGDSDSLTLASGSSGTLLLRARF